MKTELQLLLVLCLFSFNSIAQKSPNDFVFKVETDESGVTNDSAYQLRLDVAGVLYNVDIDWNDDGVFDTLNVDTTIIIQYSSIGAYTIRLRGSYSTIQFGGQNGTDANKLTSIDQWGNQAWSSCHKMFWRCDRLKSLPSGTPNFSGVSDFSQMFEFCSSLGEPPHSAPMNHWDMSNAVNLSRMFVGILNGASIGNWDVSSVTNMSEMFLFTHAFNENLNAWNVSSVTDMSAMFRESIDFNRPLNNWDVSKVNNMSRMFESAERFNQVITNWAVDSVNDMSHMFEDAWDFNQPLNNWNVSAVTNMQRMFSEARDFDQPLDSWDVSSVTNMSGIFSDANAFNQPLSNWDVSSVVDMSAAFGSTYSFDQSLAAWNFSSVTNLSNILNGSGISTQNYDSLIIHWHNNYMNSNLTVGAQFVTYCQATNHRVALINNGWVFNGDSQELNCQVVGLGESGVKERKVRIFPNPSAELVTISIENPKSERIRIFNAQGQLVQELLLNKSQTKFDVSELENGFYFLQGKSINEKLVVQH